MDAEIQQQIILFKQQCTELWLKRRYKQAISAAQNALDLTRQQLGEEHPEVASGRKLVEALYSQLEALYEAVVDRTTSGEVLQEVQEQPSASTLPDERVARAHQLHERATQLFTLGNYLAAVPLLEQAVTMLRTTLGENHLDVAVSINNLASLYQEQGRYGEAEPLYVRAIGIRQARLGADHLTVAASLNNLASLYYAQGRYGEAEALYVRALRIMEFELGPDHPDVAVSLDNLGGLYQTQGRYEEAEALYERSLDIMERQLGPDHLDVAVSLNNLAHLYKAQGRYAEAEPLSVRSLDTMERQLGSDHPDIAISLSNLAGLYYARGSYAAAESLYLRSLDILETQLGSDHPDVATSLGNLASLYDVQGRYAEAEPLSVRSLHILEKQLGPDHPDVAVSLNNLASLYYAHGRYTEAEQLMARSLGISETQLGPDHPDVATSLGNLAGLYYAQGRYAEAEMLYLRSRGIRERQLGSDHLDVAMSLNNLSLLYKAQGRYAEAETLLVRSLDISEKRLGPDHPDVATSLGNLAYLYKAQGRYAEAEPLLVRSLVIREKQLGPDHPHVAKGLHNLSTLLAATRRIEEAFRHMQRAAAIQDTLLGQISSVVSENQRMEFLATLKPNFDAFLSLVAQYRSDESEAVLAALELTLRRKTIASETLAVQQELILGVRYPHLKEQLDQLTSLRRQIAQDTLAGPGTRSLATYRQLLDQVNKQKVRLHATLARQIPELNLQQKLRESSRQAIALSLPQDAALVEFVRYDRYDFQAVPARGERLWQPARYLAFVLLSQQPDDVCMVDLGEAEPIDRLVSSFRDAILQAASAEGNCLAQTTVSIDRIVIEEAGEALRLALIAPLVAALGDCKHLLLSLDGDLTRLAFGALPSEEMGQYLGEEYRFSYLSVGRDALRFGAATTMEPEPSVICANPNYRLTEAVGPPASVAEAISTSTDSSGRPHSSHRHREAVPSRPALSSPHAQVKVSRLPPDFDRSGLRFDPLPGTEVEGDRIATLLGVTPWIAGNALEQPLKACRSPYVLHLATHGFFLNDHKRTLDGSELINIPQSEPLSSPGMANPLLRSGLALAGVNTFLQGQRLPVAAEDGLLTAEDVSGLDLLATELVVLSACETGLGDVHTGEGVMALRRAFMLAGAKTLVMSLWKGDDVATALLMERFYRNLLEAGMERDRALYAAQQSVRGMTATELRQEIDWLSGGDAQRLSELQMRFNHFAETDCPFAAPYYWAAFICQGSTKPFK